MQRRPPLNIIDDDLSDDGDRDPDDELDEGGVGIDDDDDNGDDADDEDDEVLYIDSSVITDTMQRHGHDIQHLQPVQPAVSPPDPPQQSRGIILENFQVLDGADSANRVRIALRSNQLPHFYINPATHSVASQQSLNQLFGLIENKLAHGIPPVITLMKSAVCRKSDIVDAENMAADRYFFSPIIAGNLLIVAKYRDTIDFYTVDGTRLIPVPVASLEGIPNVVEKIASINYFTIFAGILTKESRLVVVDCLNFCGVDLSAVPYSFRLQRVHAIAAVFPDDTISAVPISPMPQKFLESMKRSKQPFFIIDASHVHVGQSSLVSVAKFSGGSDSGPADAVIDRWDVETNLGTEAAPENQAPAVEDPGAFQIAGKRLCVTGSVPGTTKDFLKSRVKELGGTWEDIIKSNNSVDYLFTGANPSAILMDVAARRGVKILPALDLVAFIKHHL